MDSQSVNDLFNPLWDDLTKEDNVFELKPLLAHYTSSEVIEKILVSEEIWLSNPLYMNDVEEVVFGFRNAGQIIRDSQIIRDAFKTQERLDIFQHYYDYYVNQFEQEGLLDTYVFCLSEHRQGDQNGLLSMWRGYGSNGRGAAIVFDTAALTPQVGTTMTIAKVYYLTSQDRRDWLSEKADQFATIVDSMNLPDDKIYIAAHSLYDRVKLFSLFTKHEGFREENEWRVVYLSGRGSDEGLPIEKGYLNTSEGVQPKLKLRIQPFGDNSEDINRSYKIINSIILGPSAQSTLSAPSFQRMLDIIGKPELKDRVVASSIPYRPL